MLTAPWKQMLLFTPRLGAKVTTSEVTGCPNNWVFRQEDNQRDFGCWLNCSNWWLNEFKELEGRGWANEASPEGRRSHCAGGPRQPRCVGNSSLYQEIRLFQESVVLTQLRLRVFSPEGPSLTTKQEGLRLRMGSEDDISVVITDPAGFKENGFWKTRSYRGGYGIELLMAYSFANVLFDISFSTRWNKKPWT